jgi:sulfate permease, SulP family
VSSRFFPFLAWLPLLRNRATLRADVLAGLTGAIVVLPQGVAFATLAGMPPQYGLYAAMVPCIIAALFGSSRIMVTGPANAISLMVLALVAPLAQPESPRYIALVITLSFMAGCWQLLLGLMRAGKFAEYVSHTVIVGFTCGAAILIINSQIGNFFGLPIPRGLSVAQTLQQFFAQLANTSWPALATGLFSLTIALFAKRWNHIIPYMLVAMIAGALCAAGISHFNPGALIRTVAALPGALPPLSMPIFEWQTWQSLLIPSLVMTLLAIAEALSIAQAVGKKRNQIVNANQELIGQGLANVAGSFTSAYPASGSFNRSGVNLAANAVTPFSAVCAALLLVLLLLFVAPLAKYLPYPAMAAILFLVAINLIDLREVKHLLADPIERIVFLVTFIATLTLSLEWAIGLGIAVSLMLARRNRI